MFGFVKKAFFAGLTILSSFTSVNSLSCISMNNQECKVRPQIVNVNSNEPVFFPFSIKISKCSGSCNDINDSYAKMCVPDVIKNLKVKVFNLMSRTNKTRHIEGHETCKCKCRLDGSVCNNKQRWNNDKCRCEFKELVDKGAYDKGFIWNSSICECECDKSCNVGEHLDYKNCNCRKKIVDKLVEECSETVEEVKLAKITSVGNENKHKCSSCRLLIVLFLILFTINVGIGTYFLRVDLYVVLVLKQPFIKISFVKLVSGRSQTNIDQKSNLLFFQQHYQS